MSQASPLGAAWRLGKQSLQSVVKDRLSEFQNAAERTVKDAQAVLNGWGQHAHERPRTAWFRDREATLIIERSTRSPFWVPEAHCSMCGLPCDPHADRHLFLLSVNGPANSESILGPGCEAKFVNVSSQVNEQDWVDRQRAQLKILRLPYITYDWRHKPD